jgi:hypothetical protein
MYPGRCLPYQPARTHRWCSHRAKASSAKPNKPINTTIAISSE